MYWKKNFSKREALLCDFLLRIIRRIEVFPCLFLYKAFLFSCLDHSQNGWSEIHLGSYYSSFNAICQSKYLSLHVINSWACPWQTRYLKKPKHFHAEQFCLVNDNSFFASSSEASPDTKYLRLLTEVSNVVVTNDERDDFLSPSCVCPVIWMQCGVHA